MKKMVALVALVFKEIIMQEKIEERNKKIAYIQNTIWDIYKTFLDSHDIAEYDRRWSELMEKYRNKADEEFFSFCKCQFISWEQIIRNFAEEFRNSGQ